MTFGAVMDAIGVTPKSGKTQRKGAPNVFGVSGGTRAKRLLIMIGNLRALKEITVNDESYTGLIAHMKSVFAISSLFKAF